MHKQTKAYSVLESIVNTVIGVIIGFTVSQLAHNYETWIQQYIWAGFMWKLSVGSNIVMTLVLTIASLIRGYVVRRFFNDLSKERLS